MQAKKKGILTPETSHTGRQCLGRPNTESDSHMSAAATGPPPSEVNSFLVEAVNGRAKTKTTKTFPGSAAAAAAAINKEDRRVSGVWTFRKFWSCLHGCSISGGRGTTNGVTVLLASVLMTTTVRG